MAKKKRRGAGRESLLTPERQAKIIQALRSGNYLEVAARFAGVAPSTVHEWIARGRGRLSAERTELLREDSRFAKFAEAVKEAEAQAEINMTARVALASGKNWQAAAWMLERKNPGRWGQRVRMTVENELNGFIEKLEATLPAEVFEQVLDAVADATRPEEGREALEAGEGSTDEGDPLF